MKVKEIMHHGAACVDDDAALREVARIMRKNDVGAVPVSSNGQLVGMITDRDIACRAVADGADLDEFTARDVMTKGAICCSLDDEVSDAVSLMERERIRRLPVMDDGALVGIVSLGDISSRAPAKLSAEVLKAVSAHHN